MKMNGTEIKKALSISTYTLNRIVDFYEIEVEVVSRPRKETLFCLEEIKKYITPNKRKASVRKNVAKVPDWYRLPERNSELGEKQDRIRAIKPPVVGEIVFIDGRNMALHSIDCGLYIFKPVHHGKTLARAKGFSIMRPELISLLCRETE